MQEIESEVRISSSKKSTMNRIVLGGTLVLLGFIFLGVGVLVGDYILDLLGVGTLLLAAR
jgi:TM2 domain-containing membrane protein YozV